MESSGDMTFEMFWSNVSTNGAWKQVLLDVCSAKDEIAPQKWWKVGPIEPSIVLQGILTRGRYLITSISIILPDKQGHNKYLYT